MSWSRNCVRDCECVSVCVFERARLSQTETSTDCTVLWLLKSNKISYNNKSLRNLWLATKSNKKMIGKERISHPQTHMDETNTFTEKTHPTDEMNYFI